MSVVFKFDNGKDPVYLSNSQVISNGNVMKKIIACMILPFLFLACSSVQKSEMNKVPFVVSSPDPLDYAPSVTDGWALYSHGLNMKRLALKDGKNPDKKKQLQKAIFYFHKAEKSGKALEYTYNQLSDCYYHLYDFTRAIEYAELAIQEDRTYSQPYYRLYSIYMRLRNKKRLLMFCIAICR